MKKSALKIKNPIVLATASVARRNLLKMTGIPFDVDTPKIDESRRANENPRSYVRRLAREKSMSIKSSKKNALVVTVDTIIVGRSLQGRPIFGKPASSADAKRMLKKLSGKWHDVYSGIAIRDTQTNRIEVEVVKSSVKFLSLTDEMIDWYISTGEPIGKAGAYAIQGKGSLLVESVRGCFTNVVGLSLPTLFKMLTE